MKEANRGRKAGELAQYGCSMTGFAFTFSEMVGDVALVIFGERDCANAFPRQRSALTSARTWHVFSAGLGEGDVVAGHAEERLDACLRAVVSDVSPRAILVLSTCLSEMIGADPEPVCRTVEDQTGVRVISVRTNGLVPKTQAQVADWVARTLVGEFGDRTDPTRLDGQVSVNLIGYQTDRAPHVSLEEHVFRAEAARVLGLAGVAVNAEVPVGADINDWTALPRAEMTVVPEMPLFAALLKLLDGPGHDVVEIPPPKGIASTDAFYRGVAKAVDREFSTPLESLDARRKALELLEDAKKRFTGLRLAYGIGSQHNFRPDQLAMEGLSDLALCIELGFDVQIVIQERDYPEVHQRIQRNLAALKVDVPYTLFYEPAVLAPVLADGNFEVAYVADFLADQVHAAGIPMVPFGRLQSGYWGAGESAKLFDRAMGAVFEHRYGRYLRGNSGGR